MDPGKCKLARLDALGFGQLIHLLHQCQVLHQTTQYRLQTAQYRLQTTQYRSQTTRYRLQSSANHRLLSRLSKQFCLATVVTGHQRQHRPAKLLTASQTAVRSMPIKLCRLSTGCFCSVLLSGCTRQHSIPVTLLSSHQINDHSELLLTAEWLRQVTISAKSSRNFAHHCPLVYKHE